MAGDESDDYMNTAGTTAYVSLGSVLNADDSILPLLDAPPGRAFERLADGSFIEVQDRRVEPQPGSSARKRSRRSARAR